MLSSCCCRRALFSWLHLWARKEHEKNNVEALRKENNLLTKQLAHAHAHGQPCHMVPNHAWLYCHKQSISVCQCTISPQSTCFTHTRKQFWLKQTLQLRLNFLTCWLIVTNVCIIKCLTFCFCGRSSMSVMVNSVFIRALAERDAAVTVQNVLVSLHSSLHKKAWE